MPLLDHFHEPITEPMRWESLHGGWTTRIADALNERWLSERYLAVERCHAGPRVEIDVATFEEARASSESPSGNGSVATLLRTWTVPVASCTIPAIYPDSFEVLVYAQRGGWNLVGAIELISPSNKDRPDERRAFAAKCVSYLHEGVSVVLIDVVTTRRANLHNEILNLLSGSAAARLPDEDYLYAAAYRPARREKCNEIDVWTEVCAVGSPLPTMPLRLMHNVFVAVEFEETYMETCRRRRLL